MALNRCLWEIKVVIYGYTYSLLMESYLSLQVRKELAWLVECIEAISLIKALSNCYDLRSLSLLDGSIQSGRIGYHPAHHWLFINTLTTPLTYGWYHCDQSITDLLWFRQEVGPYLNKIYSKEVEQCLRSRDWVLKNTCSRSKLSSSLFPFTHSTGGGLYSSDACSWSGLDRILLCSHSREHRSSLT